MKTLLILAVAATLTDGEVWNEGVDYYRAGDVTNALRVLKPLVTSRTHGARAAEAVAKLEYDQGNLENAAAAAHTALLLNPEDAIANRNFTRATDRLPAERERKRLDAILKNAQGKDPGELLKSATYEARKLMKEAGEYRTNRAEKAVAMADRLSMRAAKLADAWVPLRETIAQCVTNQEQAATIIAELDQAQSKTERASKEISDLEPQGYATMSDVEYDFTRFYKLTALPPAAIDEGLLAQSNAWQDVEAFNNRAWQQEALDFTRVFRQKFPAWARAYEQQAQSDTNKPPFTAEDQAKVSALATEAEKIQLECVEKNLPADQERAIELLGEIKELLPKDKSGGGQNQQNNQQQQQNQDQQQNQQGEQNPQDGQDQQNDLDGQNDEQKESEEQQPEEQDAQAGESQEESQEDKEVEALLQKAQERNDEHEAEKKARMRKAPLPPNERDW